MARKKNPQALAGTGAGNDAGITDNKNCNTDIATVSISETKTADDRGVKLPIRDVYPKDDVPASAGPIVFDDVDCDAGSDDAKGVAPKPKKAKGTSSTMMAAMNVARPKTESFRYATRTVVNTYLKALDPDNLPAPEEAERDVSDAMAEAICLHNTAVPKEERWTAGKYLEPDAIAELMVPLCHIAWIALERGERKSQRLGIYDEVSGLYVFDEEYFDAAMSRFHGSVSKTMHDTIMRRLRSICRERGIVKDVYRGNLFVKVGNGIYNRSTCRLRPNTPEMVFVNGVSTHYNPDAVNVTRISPNTGKEYDIESLMLEWANYNEDRCKSLWQTLAMLARPNEPRHYAVFLNSRLGNNGKGTFCKAGTNMIGMENVLTVSFAQFAHKFALYGIEGYTAIISDENNVKDYNDAPENFKAAIKGDRLMAEGKGKQPYGARFHGNVVECINSRIRVADTTDSFMRRIVFINFLQHYEGVEDEWVRDGFLEDPDVLEYMLKKCLEMDLSNGVEVCDEDAAEKENFDRGNNYVVEFVHDVLSRTTWDVIPAKFSYKMYRYWMADEVPSAHPMNRPDYLIEVGDIMRRYGERLGWKWIHGTDSKVSIGSKMSAAEPMLGEYKMTDLRASEYDERTHRVVLNNYANPSMVPKTKCHGFVRVDSPVPPSTGGDDGDGCDGPDAGALSPDSTSADAYSTEKAERQQAAVGFVEDIVTSTQWDLLPWDYLHDRVSRYMLSKTGDPVAFVTDEAFHAAVEGLLQDKPGLGFDVVRDDDGAELEWPTWELMKGLEDVHTADACDISRDQRADRAVLWSAPLLHAGGREVPDRMYMVTTHPSMAGPVRRSAVRGVEG